MPIDKTLIIRKIKFINEDMVKMERLSRMSFKVYESKYENEIVAERLIERIIGRMIDINYHIITASGYPPPKDFYESFTKLAELGILEGQFAQRMAQAAGLRNRLAHEYNGIDSKKIYQALKQCFTDMPVYLSKITGSLNKTK